MKRRKLTGIGIGPGNSDLMSVRAARAIGRAQTVFCPKGKRGPGIAYQAAKDWIQEDAKVIELDFPMLTEDGAEVILKEQWERNAQIIKENLDQGEAVFLTLGDPMIYSTYSYITDYLNEAGIETENVPGIPAFCTLANLLNIPIVQGDESFAVISMTQEEESVRRSIQDADNIIVMKVNSNPALLKKILEEEGIEDRIVLASDLGRGGEQIRRGKEAFAGKIPYLSTALIKKKGNLRS